MKIPFLLVRVQLNILNHLRLFFSPLILMKRTQLDIVIKPRLAGLFK